MKQFAIILSFGTWLFLMATHTRAQGLSLEAALQHGLANRPEVEAAKVGTELSVAQADQLRANWMPKVTASADFRWNPQLQTSVIPLGAFGIPGIPSDAVSNVQFGTAFVNTVGVQAEQRILAPGSKIDRRINALNTQAQALTVEQQEINVRQAISQAYFAAIYEKVNVQLAREGESRALVRLNDGKVKLENGAAIVDEFERLKLAYRMAQQATLNAQEDYRLALTRLAHETGHESLDGVVLTDSLESLEGGQGTLTDRSGNRPDLALEKLSLATNELNAQGALLRRLPTVSAYGAYGVQQLNNNPNPFEAKTWFPNSYLGVRASMVLFDGRQARLDARDAQFRIRVDSLDIARVERAYALEIETAATKLARTKVQLMESKENLVLEQRLYATDLLRSREGSLTATELRNSEFSLQNAEHNRLLAVYNFLIAELQYRNATGNL